MAIARDATSKGRTPNATDNTLTVSHTCTGSNLILFVFPTSNAVAQDITGITYNTVAMTQLSVSPKGYNTLATPINFIQGFYLINPSTGANNIVATRSNGATKFSLGAASYTGVSQTGFPDAIVASGEDPTATDCISTLTVGTTNAWTVLGTASQRTTTAGVGSSANLADDGTLDGGYIYDSNSALGTGSYTMHLTINGGVASAGNATGTIMVSIAPAAGTTTLSTRRTLMGVGI